MSTFGNELVIQQADNASQPFTVFIMGPTATGKTDLAMALFDELPCDLVSVDSALVYRGMDIGTAKPDAETLKKYPHALIDMVDPADTYSVGRFREDALQHMADAASQQRVPVLVGGTMMYFNGLQKGMANMPDISDAVRAAIAREAETAGIAAMHQRLATVDPEAANRIHPNDPQRIKRALEVYDSTGKTLSEYWREQEQENDKKDKIPYNRIKIALMPPDDRQALRVRIEQRFDLMLKNGFIEEVEALYARGDLHEDLPSIRAVGYRQVWSYIKGELSYQEMREKAIIATAQLAKRQMTWLRKEQDCNFLDPFELNRQKVLKNLKILLS